MVGLDSLSRREVLYSATAAFGAASVLEVLASGQPLGSEHRRLVQEHLACMVPDWYIGVELMNPRAHTKGIFRKLGPPPAWFDASVDGFLRRMWYARRLR